MKGQGVRLVDVYVLGPFMVWSGARESTLPEWARVGLVLTGALTIAYNAHNYVGLRRW